MTPELTVVLPVYNQADHIVEVAQRYVSVFRRRPWQILLVPNGCRDDSPRLCRNLAKKHKNIRVIESIRGGWGYSVRLGLRNAHGRFIGYTNSARTDPAVILPLVERLRKNPESLVKIERRERGHPLRELGSLMYNLECRLLLGTGSPDVNGTPKLFPQKVYQRMNLVSDGDLLDAEVMAWCGRLGVPVLETPLEGWGRHGGKSTTGFKSAARMYLGVLDVRRGMP